MQWFKTRTHVDLCVCVYVCRRNIEVSVSLSRPSFVLSIFLFCAPPSSPVTCLIYFIHLICFIRPLFTPSHTNSFLISCFYRRSVLRQSKNKNRTDYYFMLKWVKSWSFCLFCFLLFLTARLFFPSCLPAFTLSSVFNHFGLEQFDQLLFFLSLSNWKLFVYVVGFLLFFQCCTLWVCLCLYYRSNLHF